MQLPVPPKGLKPQVTPWQPILLQKSGGEGLFGPAGGGGQVKEVDVIRWQKLKLNVTCVSVDVCVEPRPDVAVHAFVIPDMPPADSHPWS